MLFICVPGFTEPEQQHGKAVKWIGHHLKVIAMQGLKMKPMGDIFICYTDASFARNFHPKRVEWDKD